MSNRSGESPLMRLRKLRGIKQKELAEALGVSEATVRNWERGRAVAELTIPQTKILCQILQCGLNEIPDDFAPPKEPERESPLKILRQRAGLNRSELARELTNTGGNPILERTIEDWEEKEDQIELSIPQCRTLCQVLGLTIDELAEYLEQQTAG